METMNSIASKMRFHEGTRHTNNKGIHSPICLQGNEEYYVADATRARMLVMFYRIILETRPRFETFDERQKCPMLKCFQEFKEPAALMLHLVECQDLNYGEVVCWKCNDFHEFPTTEKAWAARLDPKKKKGRSVRKGTSQMLRKLSGRRGSHHKESHVVSYAVGDFDPSFYEAMSTSMEDEILSAASSDPVPLYAPPTAEVQHFEADSTTVSELPGMQSSPPLACIPTRSPLEFSYSEIGFSPISLLIGTDGSMDSRSNLPSQTGWVSPRSTVDGVTATSQTKSFSLALQTDVITDSPLCASPDDLHPDCQSETPPWSPEFVQGHDDHRQSPERSLTGSTLQSSTGDFYNDALVSANFASFHPAPSSQPPAMQPRAYHSVSSSGSYKDCDMFSRSKPNPGFSEFSRTSDSSVLAAPDFVPGDKHQIAELDGSSVKSRQGRHATVSITQQPVSVNGEIRDLVCDECDFQPRGLERNKRSHMSRHKRIHKKEAFPCPVCSRTYSREDNMKKHERVAHPEFSGVTQALKRQAVESYSESSSETRTKRYRNNYSSSSSLGTLNHMAYSL